MNNQPSIPAPLAFREAGTGPTVLLVHGWLVSGRSWEWLEPGLDGFRLILPDLPGSGETPPDPAGDSLAERVSRLGALCEMLDIRDAHLVGHSMGGQLAALLAAALPARFATLTLLNPVPVQGLDFPTELQPSFRDCGGKREDIGRIVDMSCLRLDAEGRELLVEDGMRTAPASVSAAFEAFRHGIPDASLANATLPATVIATDDPFLPPAFLQSAVADRLPSGRLVMLPGPGHYPQVEMPRETAALLRDVFA